jgi:hypothetical protein
MSDKRLQDLVTFYSLLDELGNKVGGARTLARCRGRMQWPARGVHFFDETGDNRTDTGEGFARGAGWYPCAEGGRKHDALGTVCPPTGASSEAVAEIHRGSIFRLIVGTALIGRDGHKFPTWGEGGSAAKDIRAAEVELERAVSEVIRNMPFLWLAVE